MNIGMRLLASAREADIERWALQRRRSSLVRRCARRLFGIFRIQEACRRCAPSTAA